MRRIAMAVLAMALPTLARAGEPAPPAATTGVGALRVGVPAGPDAVAGFDRSLFAEAAREAGRGVVFEVAAPEAALAALDAGRIDVAAGPYGPGAIAGRRALPPVAGDGDALLKRRGDGSLLRSSDAAGKTVGVLGSPGDAARLRAEVAALRGHGPARLGASEPERDLAAGRLAALAGALADVTAAVLARPDAFEPVGPPFGRVVRLVPLARADPAGPAADVDAALRRMAADGRLAALQRRWFGLAFEASAPQLPPVTTSKP